MFLKLIALFADNICMTDMDSNNSEMRSEPEVNDELKMDETLLLDNENKSDCSVEHDQVSSEPSEAGATEEIATSEDEYADLSQSYVPDRRQDERDDDNRRRDERTGFTYPLELKIFSAQLTDTFFSGYIEDISVSGAGIKFEDRYGRVQVDGLAGKGAKLLVSMPHGDDIALLSTIMWIRRDMNEKMIVKVGIAFQRLEDWQLNTVKKLISLKNKDQNMMWNLFENYEKNIR